MGQKLSTLLGSKNQDPLTAPNDDPSSPKIADSCGDISRDDHSTDNCGQSDKFQLPDKLDETGDDEPLSERQSDQKVLITEVWQQNRAGK